MFDKIVFCKKAFPLSEWQFWINICFLQLHAARVFLFSPLLLRNKDLPQMWLLGTTSTVNFQTCCNLSNRPSTYNKLFLHFSSYDHSVCYNTIKSFFFLLHNISSKKQMIWKPTIVFDTTINLHYIYYVYLLSNPIKKYRWFFLEKKNSFHLKWSQETRQWHILANWSIFLILPHSLIQCVQLFSVAMP